MAIKFGICNQLLPGMGIFGPRIISDMKLDGMSIEMGSSFEGYPVSQKRVQAYYLEQQQKYSIEYPNLGLSDLDNLPIHAKKGTKEHDAVAFLFKTAIETAIAMNISYLMIPCFVNSLIQTDEEVERAADMLQYACDLAEDKVTLGLETPVGAKMERKLIEMVDRKNIGIFYDSGNYHFDSGLDQVEQLELLYDLMIPQLHVKDGIDGVKSGALLGTGTANFYGSMKALKEHNYEGWIISENFYGRSPLRDLDPDYFVTLKKDMDNLRKAVDW